MLEIDGFDRCIANLEAPDPAKAAAARLVALIWSSRETPPDLAGAPLYQGFVGVLGTRAPKAEACA
jgi:hypothetical protein